MRLHFELEAGHADRVRDPLLVVHRVAARQLMDHLAVVAWHTARARRLDGPHDVVVLHLAAARSERDRAPAVGSSEVAPGETHDGGAHLLTAESLDAFEGARNRAGDLLDVDDHPLTHALCGDLRSREHAEAAFKIRRGDEHRHLRRPDVDAYDHPFRHCSRSFHVPRARPTHPAGA